MVDLPPVDPQGPEPQGVNVTDKEGVVHNYVGAQSVPLSEYVDTHFNPQEGIRGRDGGPYLDDVERAREEQRRAFLEGRAPNWQNLYQGFIPGHELVDNLASNPGSWEKDSRFSTVPKPERDRTPSDIVNQGVSLGEQSEPQPPKRHSNLPPVEE